MLKPYLLALGALLISTTSTAQNWMGAMDSNWNNPANWSEWPLDDENVTIDPALYTGVQAGPILTGNSVFVPDRVFIQNGAEVTLQAGLTVADRFIVGADATVNMEAGTLTTDRLIMEGGGHFTLTTGTVNVLGVLALGDDGLAPSTFTQFGGTVNVTGEFGFDVELIPSTPTYRLITGSLTVNGDAIWFGAAPGSGQGRLLVEGGNAQVLGSVANTAGSAVDLYIGISGGELMVNGPSLDLAHSTDSLVQSAGNVVLDNSLVLESDGVVLASGGDQLIYGDVELRGVGTIRFHDVTISAGATLQHSAPDELEVSGNWLLGGTFDAANNTVAFVGALAQEVSATPFHGLRIANTGTGITLGQGTTLVSGPLVLEDGVVYSTDDQMLQLQNGATATAGSPASHVDGPLRKVGNDDFVFPVGKDGSWRRIGISGIDDQDTEFTAEYMATGYSNTSSLEQGLAAVNANEHWRLERAVTTDDAQVELFWEDAAASGLADCALLAVAHWNGTSWSGTVSSTTGSCMGNDAGSVQSSNAVPDYQVSTFGTSDGTIGYAELQPVETLLPFPQPSDEGTWVDLPAGTRSYTLFDLTGKRIASHSVSATGAGGVHVDTRELTAGLYFLQASSSTHVVASGRLVVAH